MHLHLFCEFASTQKQNKIQKNNTHTHKNTNTYSWKKFSTSFTELFFFHIPNLT